MLVIGGGVSGISAALDLADQGFKTYLVESYPSVGGRMAQLDKTFPTLDCSICILAPKMVEVARHERIELLTYSEVKEVQKLDNGNFHFVSVPFTDKKTINDMHKYHLRTKKLERILT